MQVTKKQFEPCLTALREAGRDVEFRGSSKQGGVNLILRISIDASAKADEAGRAGVRKATGYNWTAAKTAWQEAVKKAAAKSKRDIKHRCATFGFMSVRVQLVNTAGGPMENAAKGMARFAGGSMIDHDGDTPIVRKAK